MALSIISFLFIVITLSLSKAEEQKPIPVRISTLVNDDMGCPQTGILKDTIQKKILDYPMCRCGSSNNWTRIAHLDMSNSSEQCPDSLDLITSPIRGCKRTNASSGTFESVIYPVHGGTYSHICGRVLAYQTGRAGAFYNYYERNLRSLELAYVDGISLTHGPPGSRQHIWSFVKPDHYRGSTSSLIACPCSTTSGTWSHSVPSFIGNDYFCESGNPGPGRIDGMFFEDTLWDSLGCGDYTSCCEFNSPPWFCKTLPAPTTEDVELRNCNGEAGTNGYTTITNVDIFIQ